MLPDFLVAARLEFFGSFELFELCVFPGLKEYHIQPPGFCQRMLLYSSSLADLQKNRAESSRMAVHRKIDQC